VAAVITKRSERRGFNGSTREGVLLYRLAP